MTAEPRDVDAGADVTLESSAETVLIDAPTGTIHLKVSDAFVNPKWTVGGTSTSAATFDVAVSAGPQIEVTVVAVPDPPEPDPPEPDPAVPEPAKAVAIVRWRPDVPKVTKPGPGAASLDVCWERVADEKKPVFNRYEVQVEPETPVLALPRGTLGSPGSGSKAKRHLHLRGVPAGFYAPWVRAVTSYPSGEVSSDWGKWPDKVDVPEPATAPHPVVRWVTRILAAAALGVAIWLLIEGPLDRGDRAPILDQWAVFIGLLTAVAGVLFVGSFVRLSALVSGVDGRVSTSRANVALWTVAVLIALVTLITVAYGADQFGLDEAPAGNPRSGVVDACTAETLVPPSGDDAPEAAEEVPADEMDGPWVCVDGELRDSDQLHLNDTFENGLAPPYLLLLGGPFVTLAGAGFIVNRQVQNQDRQKVQSNGPERFGDAFNNDNGNADLVDIQYLLFTVVLLFGFYLTFVTNPYELPELPWGLVGLTSLSAATYLLNKSVATNGLSVEAVVPSEIAKDTSTSVRILGRNFLPEGSDGLPNGGAAVYVGSTLAPITSITNTEIKAEVPGLAANTYEVNVTTAADVTGSAGNLLVK